LNFEELGISIDIVGTSTVAATVLEADLDGEAIVTGANSNASFAIGSNGKGEEKLSIAFTKIDSTTLGLGSTEYINDLVTGSADLIVDTQDKADKLTSVLDEAIKQVSTQRSKLGAAQNRLEHTVNNLGVTSENLTAAESRIRDVDMAKEMMNFTKNNILSQAAQSMLAQANQQPQGVLQLLQ